MIPRLQESLLPEPPGATSIDLLAYAFASTMARTSIRGEKWTSKYRGSCPMTADPTSMFCTTFSPEMTMAEVYRELRNPAMIVHRAMEASANLVLREGLRHRDCRLSR